VKGSLIVNYRLSFGALQNLSFHHIPKLAKIYYFGLILVTTKWNFFGLLCGQQNYCWISPLEGILLSTVYIILVSPQFISYTLTRWGTFRIAPKFDRLSSDLVMMNDPTRLPCKPIYFAESHFNAKIIERLLFAVFTHRLINLLLSRPTAQGTNCRSTG